MCGTLGTQYRPVAVWDVGGDGEMIKPSSYVCDVCGADKGNEPGWLLLFGLHYYQGAVGVAPLDGGSCGREEDETDRHACGAGCGVRLIAQWFAERTGG